MVTTTVVTILLLSGCVIVASDSNSDPANANSTDQSIDAVSYSPLEQLKQISSEYLADLLCRPKSFENKFLFRQHFDGLEENFDAQFISDVVHDALTAAWSCKQPVPILNFLYETYQGDNQRNLQIMIQLQEQIFEVFVKAGNWEIRSRCGYVLYKIQKNSLYSSLAGEWQDKVKQLIAQLPTSVQYLFFRPEFCLLSNEYSEYLYTAGIFINNNDRKNRYVLTWNDIKPQIGTNGPITANILDSIYEDSTDFSVQLYCPLFSTYYYLLPNSNLVAGSAWPNAAATSTWKINFIADEVVTIGQKNRNICAQTNLYSQYRRYVEALNNCSPSKAGEWKLGSCIRDL